MNDFQILQKLGEGAYSTVYKVKRLVDNNIYALKKVKLLNLSDKEKYLLLCNAYRKEEPNYLKNQVMIFQELLIQEKDRI